MEFRIESAGTVRLTAIGLMIALAMTGEPRKSPLDYPAHVETPEADIGADYLVHSFSGGDQMYFTKDYLVVEIGVFAKAPLELTSASFELRVNSKQTLQPAAVEFVAASLKYPDWTQQPQAEIGAGVGDVGVVLGAPRTAGRFPGDPAGQTRYPRPPRAPEDPHTPARPVQDAAQIAMNTAFPFGRITGRAAGNLYFEYSGNVRKLKTLTLTVKTAAGDREIRLQ